MVIKIIDVKKGRTPYQLKFSVRNGELDINKTFSIDYTGTEISHNMSITELIEERLKDDLNDSFGFGPFDINKAKSVVSDGVSYVYR